MRLDHLSTSLPTALDASLSKYQLSQWGFVIFRCTYGSQTQWEQYLALLKQHANEYFEWRGMETSTLYSKLAWTIIEDPSSSLNGASIQQTSRLFKQWADGDGHGQGKQERKGSVFTDTWVYCPRYVYFVHVDQESLESVMDYQKARERGGYFCKVVRANVVLMAEEEEEEEEDDDDDEEEEEEEELLRDLRKRVKMDGLVPLYAALQENLDRWYNLAMEDGVVEL